MEQGKKTLKEEKVYGRGGGEGWTSVWKGRRSLKEREGPEVVSVAGVGKGGLVER